MRRVLLCVCVFAAALVPIRADAATTIQPGDRMWSTVGGCTLGFVVKGGGETYFMTNAHCVDRVGEDIELGTGKVFADVATFGDLRNLASDWALLKVRSAFVPQVRPTVRGIAGTPRGIATPGETDVADLLRISGHGEPFYVHPLLRENRYGLLRYHDSSIYDAVAMDNFGDSGGPIVHEPTGQALGLVSQLCLGNPCTSEGPTVQGVLERAAAKGFVVTLALGQ